MSFRILVADSAAPSPGTAAGGAPSAVSAGLTRPVDGALTGSVADLIGSRNQVPPAVRAAGGANPRRTPGEWLATPDFAGVSILDPDGWRDGTPWDQPLDHDDFVHRLNRCTITQNSHRPAASALCGTEVRDASPAVPEPAGFWDANAGKRWPPVAQPVPGAGGPGQAPTSASHSDEGGGASHASRADDVSLVISDASASRPGWGSGRDVTPDFDTHVDRAFTVGGFGPVVDSLGPRLVVPAPLTDPALREPKRVWIAVRRTGIDRHRPATGVAANDNGEIFSVECADRSCPDRRPGYGHAHLPQTACGRSIRTGHLLRADDPWIVEHTRPCRLCWPGGA